MQLFYNLKGDVKQLKVDYMTMGKLSSYELYTSWRLNKGLASAYEKLTKDGAVSLSYVSITECDTQPERRMLNDKTKPQDNSKKEAST